MVHVICLKIGRAFLEILNGNAQPISEGLLGDWPHRMSHIGDVDGFKAIKGNIFNRDQLVDTVF
jgi:hypothetical protein